MFVCRKAYIVLPVILWYENNTPHLKVPDDYARRSAEETRSGCRRGSWLAYRKAICCCGPSPEDERSCWVPGRPNPAEGGCGETRAGSTGGLWMNYIDTNIIVYAITDDPTYGKKCINILHDIQIGK